MMKHLLLMTGTLLLTTALSVAAADLPTRGMTMSQVQAEFGAPKTKHPAVGHPPITRWDYDGYSVYFDHSAVIDAVGVVSATPVPAKPATAASTSPAAADSSAGTTLNFQPLKAMVPPAGTVADDSAAMTPATPAQPAAAAPAAVTPPPPPPPPKPKYTFDPATGRIIIVAPTANSGAPAGSAASGK